jgi:hypothetical protein
MSKPIIIARREIQHAESGAVIRIAIRVPKQSENGHYECSYEIKENGQSKSYTAGGVDGIQALEIALRKIGALLWARNKASSWKLRWLDSEDLGFPLPEFMAQKGAT